MYFDVSCLSTRDYLIVNKFVSKQIVTCHHFGIWNSSQTILLLLPKLNDVLMQRKLQNYDKLYEIKGKLKGGFSLNFL